MSRWRAWSAASAVAATVLSLPALLSHLPVSDPNITATALLTRVRASSTATYSGYAESLGTLGLPSGATFTDLTDLFGARTRMRVWWRGPADWRVDSLQPAGEHGTYRDAAGVWMWDFEADRATRIDEPAYRPPITADLGPAELGRRLLSEATRLRCTTSLVSVGGSPTPGHATTGSSPNVRVCQVFGGVRLFGSDYAAAGMTPSA